MAHSLPFWNSYMAGTILLIGHIQIFFFKKKRNVQRICIISNHTSHLYLETWCFEKEKNRILCKRTLRRSYIRFRSIQHFQLDYRISRSWRQQGSKGCKKKEVWAEKKRPTTEAGRPCSWVGLWAKHATRRGNRAREFCRRDAVCFQSLAVLADCGRLGELGWPPDGDDGGKDTEKLTASRYIYQLKI